MIAPSKRLRVLLTAPDIHAQATGEEFVAFKWAEALSREVDLTVVAFQSPGRPPLSEILPGARVATFPKPRWFARSPRFDAMLKPTYPVYMTKLRRWVRQSLAQGAQYDIAHQIMPQAARYPSPLTGLGIPYVIGPLGGALSTPEAFRPEMAQSQWFTRLRALDHWRLRHDPWLRRSYAKAALLLGVAPYMRETLVPTGMRRYASVLELGIEALPPEHPVHAGPGLRLLHVGRGVRTKGLRDVVRAMSHLKDMPSLTLTSAGTGEEIAICKVEAERLGVADRIEFLGQLPREKVEDLYRQADVFVFPSFREPAGNVLYEAMSNGLPVIAAARGGPDWIVDENTGIKVDVTTPEVMPRDIAAAIRKLAADPALRERLGHGAREKLAREGFWNTKARALVTLYHEALSDAPLQDPA